MEPQDSGPPTIQPRPAPLEDAYKEVEKKYRLVKKPLNKRKTKFRPTAPDLTGVIMFETPQECVSGSPSCCSSKQATDVEDPHAGLLRPFLVDLPELRPEPIQAYEVRDAGFFVLRDAMDVATQLSWAHECVSRFSRLPHTNLTNLHGPSEEHRNLWMDVVEGRRPMEDFRRLRWANLGFNYIWGRRAYAAEHKQPTSPEMTQEVSQESAQDVSQMSQVSQERAQDVSQMSQVSQERAQDVSQMSQVSQERAQDVSQEEKRPVSRDDGAGSQIESSLPGNLIALAGRITEVVGFASPLKAEAGICNFYPLDGSMGGHVDDAELALEMPIVSLSFGNAAVFLLGGRSRDETPLALKIRSGDIVVMGRDSRLCYHGIASILPDTAPPALFDTSGYPSGIPDIDRPFLSAYLATSRINLNVRQVRRSD